nr:potassium transporter 5-like [Tanacetum cinerariifolium]
MSTPVGSKRNSNAVYIEEEEILYGQTPDQLLPESQLPGLIRHDSLDIESAKFPGHGHHDTKDWGVILRLAFQSIGVVYGGIGTSPLYVFLSTFTDGIKHNDVFYQTQFRGYFCIVFQTVSICQGGFNPHGFAKIALLFAAMLGTSVVIGDGILTPSIS